MFPEQPYQPISCDFHDVLLEKATFKEIVDIVYLVEKKETLVKTIITDVFTKKSVEYLKTKENLIIRLDHLISVGKFRLGGNSCSFKTKG